MSEGHLREYERHLNRIKANRNDYLLRRDRLIDQIRKVFDRVTREGGISLREAHVIDDYGSDAERAKARSEETDKHWTDVNPEYLDPGGSGLSFVDPIGYRYYLPAYMTHCLKTGHGVLDDSGSSGWHGYQSVTHGLDPSGYDSPELVEYFHTKHELFSAKERTCVARFLALEAELCVSDIQARAPMSALRATWMQYLPDQDRKQLYRVWPSLLG